MADIFHLDKEQQELITLLDNEQNLSGEERQELEKRLDKIREQKGNLIPQMFDIIEYLNMQNDYASAKIDELAAIKKKNTNTINRVMDVTKSIFVSTGQSMWQIGSAVFKRRKLPARLEITNPDLIPEDYKTITITVPLYSAKVIDFEHPELKLNIDESRADVKKTELKKLWQDDGIETPGCKLIDDDFKVEVKGV